MYRTEYSQLACYEEDFHTQKTYDELVELISSTYGTEERNVCHYIKQLYARLESIDSAERMPRLLRYDETRAVYFPGCLARSEIIDLERRQFYAFKHMLDNLVYLPVGINMYISEQKDIRLADVNRKAIFYRRFYKRIREFMYDPVCDGSQDALTEEERRQLKSYLRYVFELTTL